MKLIDADELKKELGINDWIKITEKELEDLIYKAPTVNKCDNCYLMFLEKTRGNNNETD